MASKLTLPPIPSVVAATAGWKQSLCRSSIIQCVQGESKEGPRPRRDASPESILLAHHRIFHLENNQLNQHKTVVLLRNPPFNPPPNMLPNIHLSRFSFPLLNQALQHSACHSKTLNRRSVEVTWGGLGWISPCSSAMPSQQ